MQAGNLYSHLEPMLAKRMSWEDTFQSWAKPPGKTELAKASNAERAIRKAIDASSAFSHLNIRVFPRGSYRNRTDVRMDSDVDICALCTDSIFFDLPEGMMAQDTRISTPAKYPFTEFKNDVENALVSYLGQEAARRGNKAFDVHENTYRVDADVVACFEYRRYRRDGSYLTGTAFLPDRGSRVVNWPEQNYKNGVASR